MNELAQKSTTELQSFDLNGQLPNLNEATAVNADFTSEYWTPTQEGETKRCFFQSIEDSTYVDEKTGESVDLPCIIVVAQDKDGNAKTIRNGSRRLVATINDNVEKGIIVKGTPLQITYLGEEKNKTNAYKSARWSVKPLIVG